MVVILVLAIVLVIASLVSQICSFRETKKKADIDKRIRGTARTIVLLSGTLLCCIIRDMYSILNNTYTIMNGLGTTFLIGWILISASTLGLLVNIKIETEK